MGCCIAIAMVIAAVRGAWFRLFPHRRPPETGFAPPAYRPAPGAADRPAPTGPILAVAPTGTAPWTAMLLGAAAITIAVYAAAIELLSLTGVQESGTPTSRHVLLAALGLAALIGAATCPGRPLPPTRSRGVVLTSAGAVWTVLSLVDMHLFHAFHAAGHHHSGSSGHSVASVLVHGVGFLVLAVGLGHLLRRSSGPVPVGSPLRTATTVRTP